jgi:Domain of unknown function (DUF4783)
MKIKFVMKAIFTSFLVGCFVVFSSFAQSGSMDAVIGALHAGNASELSKYFDNSIELTMPVKSDSYSKAQAQVIVKDFFANNGVKNFKFIHKGVAPEGIFFIGSLQTKSGNFRTTVFMKTKDNKDVVKQIKFQSIE